MEEARAVVVEVKEKSIVLSNYSAIWWLGTDQFEIPIDEKTPNPKVGDIIIFNLTPSDDNV